MSSIQGVPRKGTELTSMTNAEVRAHCLATARVWLARYEAEGGAPSDLQLAESYATIAAAFRPTQGEPLEGQP